jgi:hypothetical protein
MAKVRASARAAIELRTPTFTPLVDPALFAVLVLEVLDVVELVVVLEPTVVPLICWFTTEYATLLLVTQSEPERAVAFARNTISAHCEPVSRVPPLRSRCIGRLSRISESCLTYVVQGASFVAYGRHLDTGGRTVCNDQIGRQGHLRHTEGSVTSRVPQRQGESVVEVGHVGSEAEVDEDVRPRVMQPQLDATTIQGPISLVSGAGRDTAACSCG